MDSLVFCTIEQQMSETYLYQGECSVVWLARNEKVRSFSSVTLAEMKVVSLVNGSKSKTSVYTSILKPSIHIHRSNPESLTFNPTSEKVGYKWWLLWYHILAVVKILNTQSVPKASINVPRNIYVICCWHNEILVRWTNRQITEIDP